jgi:hypothetical protein
MALLPRAGLSLAALTLAIGLVAAPASAHPGVPAAIFDQNEVAWTSAQDLTSAQFETALTGGSPTRPPAGPASTTTTTAR